MMIIGEVYLSPAGCPIKLLEQINDSEGQFEYIDQQNNYGYGVGTIATFALDSVHPMPVNAPPDEDDDYWYDDGDEYDYDDEDYGDFDDHYWTYTTPYLRRNKRGQAYVQHVVRGVNEWYDGEMTEFELRCFRESLRELPAHHRAVCIEYARAGRWDQDMFGAFEDEDLRFARLDDAYANELPRAWIDERLLPNPDVLAAPNWDIPF